MKNIVENVSNGVEALFVENNLIAIFDTIKNTMYVKNLIIDPDQESSSHDNLLNFINSKDSDAKLEVMEDELFNNVFYSFLN